MAADEASFNTDIDSMSLGLIWLMSPSTPSISTSGSLLLAMDDTPRMRIEPWSCPGCPEFWTTSIPEIMSCRAIEAWVMGRFSRSLTDTFSADPSRLTFFCVP